MTGSVYYIYSITVVVYGSILRQYRYATLALDIVAVHDPLLDLLVGAENAALPEHLVYQSGLAVVDVRYYGYISYFLLF